MITKIVSIASDFSKSTDEQLQQILTELYKTSPDYDKMISDFVSIADLCTTFDTTKIIKTIKLLTDHLNKKLEVCISTYSLSLNNHIEETRKLAFPSTADVSFPPLPAHSHKLSKMIEKLSEFVCKTHPSKQAQWIKLFVSLSDSTICPLYDTVSKLQIPSDHPHQEQLQHALSIIVDSNCPSHKHERELIYDHERDLKCNQNEDFFDLFCSDTSTPDELCTLLIQNTDLMYETDSSTVGTELEDFIADFGTRLSATLSELTKRRTAELELALSTAQSKSKSCLNAQARLVRYESEITDLCSKTKLTSTERTRLSSLEKYLNECKQESPLKHQAMNQSKESLFNSVAELFTVPTHYYEKFMKFTEYYTQHLLEYHPKHFGRWKTKLTEQVGNIVPRLPKFPKISSLTSLSDTTSQKVRSKEPSQQLPYTDELANHLKLNTSNFYRDSQQVAQSITKYTQSLETLKLESDEVKGEEHAIDKLSYSLEWLANALIVKLLSHEMKSRHLITYLQTSLQRSITPTTEDIRYLQAQPLLGDKEVLDLTQDISKLQTFLSQLNRLADTESKTRAFNKFYSENKTLLTQPFCDPLPELRSLFTHSTDVASDLKFAFEFLTLHGTSDSCISFLSVSLSRHLRSLPDTETQDQVTLCISVLSGMESDAAKRILCDINSFHAQQVNAKKLKETIRSKSFHQINSELLEFSKSPDTLHIIIEEFSYDFAYRVAHAPDPATETTHLLNTLQKLLCKEQDTLTNSSLYLKNALHQLQLLLESVHAPSDLDQLHHHSLQLTFTTKISKSVFQRLLSLTLLPHSVLDHIIRKTRPSDVPTLGNSMTVWAKECVQQPHHKSSKLVEVGRAFITSGYYSCLKTSTLSSGEVLLRSVEHHAEERHFTNGNLSKWLKSTLMENQIDFFDAFLSRIVPSTENELIKVKHHMNPTLLVDLLVSTLNDPEVSLEIRTVCYSKILHEFSKSPFSAHFKPLLDHAEILCELVYSTSDSNSSFYMAILISIETVIREKEPNSDKGYVRNLPILVKLHCKNPKFLTHSLPGYPSLLTCMGKTFFRSNADLINTIKAFKLQQCHLEEPDGRDCYLVTQLAKNTRFRAFKDLLTLYPELDLICTDDQGYSVADWVCKGGSSDFLHILMCIKHIDWTATCKSKYRRYYGMTPLHILAFNGFSHLLLEFSPRQFASKTSTGQPKQIPLLHVRDSQGRNLAHVAAIANKEFVIRALLGQESWADKYSSAPTSASLKQPTDQLSDQAVLRKQDLRCQARILTKPQFFTQTDASNLSVLYYLLEFNNPSFFKEIIDELIFMLCRCSSSDNFALEFKDLILALCNKDFISKAIDHGALAQLIIIFSNILGLFKERGLESPPQIERVFYSQVLRTLTAQGSEKFSGLLSPLNFYFTINPLTPCHKSTDLPFNGILSSSLALSIKANTQETTRELLLLCPPSLSIPSPFRDSLEEFLTSLSSFTAPVELECMHILDAIYKYYFPESTEPVSFNHAYKSLKRAIEVGKKDEHRFERQRSDLQIKVQKIRQRRLSQSDQLKCSPPLSKTEEATSAVLGYEFLS